QSKGKIENVVKYVKYNFAKNRVFTNIDTWNEKGIAWLERTGNYNVHNTTKKRPAEVHALEKQHLKPVSPLLSIESDNSSSITRTVCPDNVIKYKSNRYSVPLGTYRRNGDNKVFIELKESELIIKKQSQGEVLARHILSTGKGELIKNRQHARDRSKGIQAYKETIIRQFNDGDQAALFIQELSKRYPRYVRDQLQIVQYALHHFRQEMEQALTICIKDQLWSANDLRDVSQHLARQKETKVVQASCQTQGSQNDRVARTRQVAATVREMDDYIQILGGMGQ
ncbi:IS21 family transposase, partial [Sporolactobacillus kofuensis]|nr:IS21 family transposase [Sporolactobacillus kofuensis]